MKQGIKEGVNQTMQHSKTPSQNQTTNQVTDESYLRLPIQGRPPREGPCKLSLQWYQDAISKKIWDRWSQEEQAQGLWNEKVIGTLKQQKEDQDSWSKVS